MLGLWEATARDPSVKHVTIAVSGAYGGHTIDFRRLAARGVMLLGRADAFGDGVMRFSPDLASNLAQGDASYLSLLELGRCLCCSARSRPARGVSGTNGRTGPPCVTHPILELDLHGSGIAAIVWATGYALDFGWLKVDVFERSAPVHRRGVTEVPGLYFLGLSWLSRRASSFIFGVDYDAAHLADHIAARA